MSLEDVFSGKGSVNVSRYFTYFVQVPGLTNIMEYFVKNYGTQFLR